MVREDRIERGEDDGRQRSSDSQVSQNLGGETMQGKTEHQHRHDHQTATNAEQPGQHTGKRAKTEIKHELHRSHPEKQSGMVAEKRAGGWRGGRVTRYYSRALCSADRA